MRRGEGQDCAEISSQLMPLKVDYIFIKFIMLFIKNAQDEDGGRMWAREVRRGGGW